MAQSYPAQYHGITKIERTEQANQKYIQEYGHYLDELFPEKDPAQLPYLNVCYTDELASAAVMIPEALSYTWTYEENGESRTITTDAPHVLQTEPTEVTKLSEPMTMELEFDEKPESVQILSWDDSLLEQYQDSAAEIPEGTPVEVQENEKAIQNLPRSQDVCILCRDSGRMEPWITASECQLSDHYRIEELLQKTDAI